ncbi:hypothetical protein AAFF_G00009700 [Aldrovandia affinis]|uniref:Uncharacterized protein n=1 Tax=Aldrovandia affinis TaxID=143900 RepID=A0AAD7S998_9TELE|nr:hypothetical protein AAFF_G00009700 [Aldrovandia affinis]
MLKNAKGKVDLKHLQVNKAPKMYRWTYRAPLATSKQLKGMDRAQTRGGHTQKKRVSSGMGHTTAICLSTRVSTVFTP